MKFSSDRQRKAVFANMNGSSSPNLVSAIIGLYPDSDNNNDMSPWQQMYFENRFSDEDAPQVSVVESKGGDTKFIATNIMTDERAKKNLEDQYDDIGQMPEEDVDDIQDSIEQEITSSQSDDIFTGTQEQDISYDVGDVPSGQEAGFDNYNEPDITEVNYNTGSDDSIVNYKDVEFEPDVGQTVDYTNTYEYGEEQKPSTRSPYNEELLKAAEDAKFKYGAATRAKTAAEDVVFDERRGVSARLKRGFVTALEKDVSALGERAGHAPKDALVGLGKGIKGTVGAVKSGAEKGLVPALEMGALAFGTGAGGAVAGVIGEADDIMMGPQRAYTQERAGVQKVWDPARQGYRLDKIQDRVPMQPFVPQLGPGQVSGVKVRPEDYLVGQETMQRGFWGMSGAEATKAFEEKAKKSGGTPGFRPSSSYGISPIRGVSRTASSAVRQKVDLDRMRQDVGRANPTFQRNEAALQSKVDYLNRKTVPGTRQDMVMKTSGLRMV